MEPKQVHDLSHEHDDPVATSSPSLIERIERALLCSPI